MAITVSWRDRIPRMRLIHRPTPVEKLRRIGAELGHKHIYVKRDDAMELGLGGNKLRSLEFWLGEALESKCDTLLVAGTPVSNQCRLTAAAAAKVGLACVVLHNADRPDRLQGNSLLNHLYGADVRYLGPMEETQRAEAVGDFARQLQQQGRNPYIVGDPVRGAMGYVVAAGELLHQAEDMAVSFDHIIVPGSMGPTEAGLLYGLMENGFSGRVHLISVEYDAIELEQRVRGIFKGIERILGTLSADASSITRYDDSFLGRGYGIETDESRQALERFARTEALLLEPTYTAKPFAALLALIASGEIHASASVCALHTGGVPTLFENRVQES